MSATQLDIYNDALLYLGERKLATLTDNVDIRKSLDSVWDKEVDWCLENGFWNFAMRTVSIDHSTLITPSFGYSYAFDRPTDWIRTFRFADNDQLDPPLLRVRDEGGVWYADCDPLYLKFVSNDVTYGGNIASWSRSFQDFVATRLAYRIAARTTDSESTVEALEKQMMVAKKKALSIDGMNNPPEYPPSGTWVRSRGGSRLVRSTSSGMTFR